MIRKPSIGMALGLGGGAPAATLLDAFPAGTVWFNDSTVAGTADSDGNIVTTSLTDLVGTTHLAGPATVSKRPRGIPTDYLVNGRKSVLFDNDTTNSSAQYLYDPTTDNPIWKPIVQIQHGPGATLVLSGILRGSSAGTMVIGNFAGGIATPGFYVTISTTGAVAFAVWKAGATMLNVTTAAGSMVPHQRYLIIIRVRPNMTVSIIVNDVERFAGATTSGAVASNTFSNPVTMGANAGSDGATLANGGNHLCAALYHSALSDAQCAAIKTTLDAHYAVPAPAFDTGPVAGVSAIAEANVAVLGTSIDVGQDALLTNGYAGEIATNIAPPWTDLDLHFVGGYRYPGSIIDTMAVGGLTVRGRTTPSAQDGFDSIAADHANRMDHQLATMNTAGVFSSGLPLVLTCPIGWTNDIKNGFGLSMDRDRHGDLVRMLGRLVDGIRVYTPSLDIRIVLFTCIPTTNTVNSREIVLHNASVRPVATAIQSRTGCPVATADMYSAITDAATQLPDGVHPSATVQNTILAPLAANAIRYVCGLAAA